MEVPAPPPLLAPGMFVDLPEPKWKVKQKVVLREVLSKMSVVRLCEMPFPSASRLVYQSWQPTSLSELQSYAHHVLETPSHPPPCATRIYPDTIYVAHSLKQDSLLRFDSHFESGNLNRVYAISESEYDLYISPDTNTRGHTQWFYFAVTRMRSGATVKFNIVNFTKGNCLLAKGLRPVYQSLSAGPDWSPLVSDVQFYRNSYQRSIWKHSSALEESTDEAKTGYYYTLSFTHTFTHTNDTVSFAFSEPYTLSNLQEFLLKVETEATASQRISFKKEVLCETTLGLELPVVSVTAAKGYGKSGKRKQAMVFTARVHPGETPSSFIMQGLMKFLVSDSEPAKNLLANYVFHFVPMLNPDGVLLGNYRSCIEGVDLNRRWTSDTLQPILNLKTYIQSLLSERKIAMFCDLHAHSKKNNAFIYGCNTASEGGFTTWTKVRLFPRVLAKFSQYFNYEACKFKVQKDKMGTGRVVIWKDFNVTNSFTLEVSFHAYRKGTDLCPFTTPDYLSFSHHILESLSTYSDLIDQFEQEIALNGGWLKPGKLKELTGVPAQQLAAIEQEESQRKERYRQARLSNSFATPIAGVRSARSTSAHNRRMNRAVAEEEVGKSDGIAALMQGRRLRVRQKSEQHGGWRDYFSIEEVQTVLKQLKEGREFTESDSSGSDSEPSDDNLSVNCQEASDEECNDWRMRAVLEEEKFPEAATFADGNWSSPGLPEPECESPVPVRAKLAEKPALSPVPPPRKPVQLVPAVRPSPAPKLNSTTIAVTHPADTPIAMLSTAYPVSDIHKILRDTHRSNASFDYSDSGRPRIHKERKQGVGMKRTNSPIILIESYSVRKPPARDARQVGMKMLNSARHLGVSTHTTRSVYSSKPVLLATTRFGGNPRITRREFHFDSLRRPKAGSTSRPKKLDLTGLILG